MARIPFWRPDSPNRPPDPRRDRNVDFVVERADPHLPFAEPRDRAEVRLGHFVGVERLAARLEDPLVRKGDLELQDPRGLVEAAEVGVEAEDRPRPFACL